MTTKRLTAAEARKLAGPTVTEIVDDALKAIKEAAEGPRHARQIALHDDLWVNGGYGRTKEWNEAKEQLEKLGYTVEFFYEELQFVNMYTLVKW